MASDLKVEIVLAIFRVWNKALSRHANFFEYLFND